MKYGKGEDVIPSTSCTATNNLRYQGVKAEVKSILDWKSLSTRVDCEKGEGEEDI